MIEPGQPFESRPGRSRRGRVSMLFRAAAAIALTLVAVGARPAGVAAFGVPASCTGRTEVTVFAPWGDRAKYFAMPNAGFENGSTDWQLSGGAAVVAGNESYKVGGAADSKSLRIPYGATAESRTICVSMGEDTVRMFVNSAHVSGSILHVDAIVRNPTTGNTAQTSFDVNGDASSGWAPTMRLQIPNLLGGTATQELTLRFTTRGASATWSLDDVYVDPFKSY